MTGRTGTRSSTSYTYGERGTLKIWPLTSSRTGLRNPILVCDSRGEFGPSLSGQGWFVDHPIGATVRLGDGAWRHILTYRVADRGEVTLGTGPAHTTGCHMAEVSSTGEPFPPWRF
jgi:hypothetical protein